MRLFLTGIGCVGKTTIGQKVGEYIGIKFFDLDQEIENFFDTSIERLQNRILTMHSFRNEAAKALMHILDRPDSLECVIALPPSGLMGGYLRVLKKIDGIIAVINDTPENILKRIRFYDIDSHPINKELSLKDQNLYLKEIKKDITYFRNSYNRAHLQIDIFDLDADQAALKVIQSMNGFIKNNVMSSLTPDKK